MTLREQVLEKLVHGPMGKRILAEDAADRLAVRQAKATALKALKEDHLKALPALLAAEEKARQGVEVAQVALRTAGERQGEIYATRRTITMRFDRENGVLTADLIATAPPEIGGFIDELGALWAQTRRIPIASAGGLPDGRGGFTPVTSNAEAVNARLAAINEARLQAEALKLEALDAATLGKRLGALRKAVGL